MFLGRAKRRKKNQFVVNIYLFYFSGSLNTEWDELARVQVFRSVVNLFTVVFFLFFRRNRAFSFSGRAVYARTVMAAGNMAASKEARATFLTA